MNYSRLENIERDHLYVKTEIFRLNNLIKAFDKLERDAVTERDNEIVAELRDSRDKAVAQLKEWGC